MKPFDLERALAGDPVVTRDGKKILEIYYFKYFSSNYPVIAYIENRGIVWFSEKGKYFNIKEEDNLDLFMAPKTKKINLKIYKYGEDNLYEAYNMDRVSSSQLSSSPWKFIKEIEVEVEE